MNCERAERLITDYINHTMNIDELEEFLDHVEDCPSCYEELETYFTVFEATRHLDDEVLGSVLDLKKAFQEDLNKSRAYLMRVKAERTTKKIITAFCSLSMIVFLTYIGVQIVETFF